MLVKKTCFLGDSWGSFFRLFEKKVLKNSKKNSHWRAKSAAACSDLLKTLNVVYKSFLNISISNVCWFSSFWRALIWTLFAFIISWSSFLSSLFLTGMSYLSLIFTNLFFVSISNSPSSVQGFLPPTNLIKLLFTIFLKALLLLPCQYNFR